MLPLDVAPPVAVGAAPALLDASRLPRAHRQLARMERDTLTERGPGSRPTRTDGADPGASIMSPTVNDAARERFAELVRLYGRLVGSAVGRVAGRAGSGLRDDVAQEVLLALWKQVEREQAIDHPASYVYRAAVRATVRIVRREQRRAGEPLDETLPGEACAAPRALDPQAALEGRERAAVLEAGLRALSADRERAVRAHLSGFDVREIMELYGWTYQKSRNLIARGMADLRLELRARGIHGS